MINLTKTIKFIRDHPLHVFGLTLSELAILHTMWQFSDDIIFKLFFGVGGMFAGLSIQYLRGLAAAYRRQNQKGKANGLWFIVIACIIIFDFTSSFGVLVTQINKGEEEYSSLAADRKDLEDEIDDLKRQVKSKGKQQNTEFFDNKGRGGNYNVFQDEIDALNGKIEEKKAALKSLRKDVMKLDKSMFSIIEEKSRITGFFIQFTMALGLMFLIYFIPLLTPWDVTIPGKNVTSNTIVTPPKVTPDKKDVTLSKPRYTVKPPPTICGGVDKEPCVCGCGRPRRGNSAYFSGACRTRMSRRKAEEGKRVLV